MGKKTREVVDCNQGVLALVVHQIHAAEFSSGVLRKSAVREFWTSCCRTFGNLCTFGQSQWCRPVALANLYRVRLARWIVEMRPWYAPCRRFGVPYMKELQLCSPSWQVYRGFSIHLGSTNMDADPLVRLVCYLANQWCWDLLAQPKWNLLSCRLVEF